MWNCLVAIKTQSQIMFPVTTYSIIDSATPIFLVKYYIMFNVVL